MRLTRRHFLGTTLGAALATTSPKKSEAQEPQTIHESKKDKAEESQVAKAANEDQNIETYGWIDPNLSTFATTIAHNFAEVFGFHYFNYKKFESGSTDITEANLIHNVSEKWSNAFANLISCSVAYGGRSSFIALTAHNDLEDTEEARRQKRVSSDWIALNTHYGKSVADRYLTNSFQHLLREAYKKILKDNQGYEYKPWKVGLIKVIKTMKEIRTQELSKITQDIKATKNKDNALAFSKSTRDCIDLFLISFSYVCAFVDFIPLLSANTISIYTASPATAITVGNLPASAFAARDLLRRLKAQQNIDGDESFNEQKLTSAAEIYLRSFYWLMNAGTQSSLDSFGFKEKSRGNVKHSNARGLHGLAGGVAGSAVLSIIKYLLESSFRSNIKKSNREKIRESLLNQFSGWYFNPNLVNK